MTDDRTHIVTALRSIHAADLALGTYTETGDPIALDTACSAARRLRSALASQRHLIRKENRTMAKKSTKPMPPKKGKGGKGKSC